MTQTGKCDTCRQRKVKCDEERPKCGACRKKDRPCSYSYGKASAFVVQDPNQMTKHGKSRVAPVVYTLESSEECRGSPISTPSDLHITTEREAENGRGFFQTLAPTSRRKAGLSRKAIAQQRRKLELYLQHLQSESAIATIKPSCSESTLIARYIDMLGSDRAENKPLSILGTWIQSIPSRIGSNKMMDLAVEFFVNSFAVYWNDNHSTRSLASVSKEKALKELQLFVFNASKRPTYDVILATKMHYAAEALLGIDTMYHAIHAFGLAELLKSGVVANVDDEHFWNLIDNTYIDEVNEAMVAGRKSLYDNDFYLSSTYPPSISSNVLLLSSSQRASMAIMHAFIQCPRLSCLVRYAIAHPDNTTALAAAITLAESLWQLDLPAQVAPLLGEAVTITDQPLRGLTDIVTNCLHFDSVQNMILCTRYWLLVSILGGLIDTLYRHFPTETSLSLLPDRYVMHQIETDAAIQLAKSIPWADSLSYRLPLVPLRLHSPLQISLGPWHRNVQRLNAIRASNPDLNPELDLEMTRTIAHAERMKSWIIEECNRIHKQWDVSVVASQPLYDILGTMAGEKIPDWLPIRVRFEAEDGEMIMRLDYENKTGTYNEHFDVAEHPPRKVGHRNATAWSEEAGLIFRHEQNTREDGADDSTLQNTLKGSYRNESMEPRNAADFFHGTGRNLCSTSGWWPSSEDASTVQPDSPTDPAFLELRALMDSSTDSPLEYTDRNPCLASSFWPQVSNSTVASLGNTPENPVKSPAWSSLVSQMTTTFDNRPKSSKLSPDWTSNGLPTPFSRDSSNDVVY